MKAAIRFTVLAVVVIAVAVIIGVKIERPRKPFVAAPTATVSHAHESVLLFADLREANEGDDGCAVIIRTVRSAQQHGIAVTEFDAGAAPDVRRKYRVLVEPTVIVLDAAGRETSRHEGEDSATVAAVRTDIARLSSRGHS